MGDEQQPDRVKIEHPPIPVVPYHGVYIAGVSMDNVYKAETPSSLVAGSGEDGVKTEWDASSLDSAITWLETHASYLNRLSHSMTDIQDLMGGPAATTGASVPGASASPLGSFPWAQRLAAKHASLYSGTEAALRRLSENLYNAAEALRKVKENYETAEGANAMSAAEMAQIFANVARNGQA
jgi:hypothetical protein